MVMMMMMVRRGKTHRRWETSRTMEEGSVEEEEEVEELERRHDDPAPAECLMLPLLPIQREVEDEEDQPVVEEK